jgi:hypothetical protein
MGVWPKMLAWDRTSRRFSKTIDDIFPEYQLVALNHFGRTCVAGVAHAVPLRIGSDLGNLPENGWDWAVEKAIFDRSTGTQPDSLCGLSVSVLPMFQRAGVGSSLIKAMISAASRRGMSNVVMPVRPISKEQWPYVSMNEFLNWRRADGLHQDPWIRAHQRIGGAIQRTCDRSMTVVAPVKEWEIWAERAFKKSGRYAVRGALAPIHLDLTRGVGRYEEPNVWMVYSCRPARKGVHDA